MGAAETKERKSVGAQKCGSAKVWELKSAGAQKRRSAETLESRNAEAQERRSKETRERRNAEAQERRSKETREQRNADARKHSCDSANLEAQELRLLQAMKYERSMFPSYTLGQFSSSCWTLESQSSKQLS